MKISIDGKVEGAERTPDWVDAWSDDVGIMPQVDLFSTVPENTQILVVEHRVRYLKPLDYRNVPAHVDLWISTIKAASFDISYEFHDPVDGGVCVRAATTLAFFSVDGERLLRLSPGNKEALARYAADPIFR